MKKFLLVLLSIILLVGASCGLVFGITNFNKLGFNVKGPENSQQQTTSNSDTELINKYKKEIASLNEQISELNSQMGNMQTDIENRTKEIESLTSQKSDLEKQIEDLTTSEAENTQKIADLNSKVALLNTQIEEKTAECQSLESQKTSLTSQVTELQSKVSYYENLLSGFDFIFVLTDCNKKVGGKDIWYDRDNIYYSNRSTQYVFDKETNTWVDKTWSGTTWYLAGSCMWTDGENLYSSIGGTVVLNRETQSWDQVTFSGLEEIYGNYVWSEGDNIYYSDGTNHYVLDKETKTWNTKAWEGLTKFSGQYIWNYNDVIYCFYGSSTYELNIETDTWVLSDCGFNTLIKEDGTKQEKYLPCYKSNLFVYNDSLYFFGNGYYIFDFVNKGWVRILNNTFPSSGVYANDFWTVNDKCYFSVEVGSIGGGDWYQYEFIMLNKD